MSARSVKGSVNLEKVPPQNLEAEQSVLGSMLIEREAIGKAIEVLNEGDFYKESHGKIYSAVLDLFEKNEPIDLVTIVEELRSRGKLDQIGGASYITALINSVPTAANVEYYAKIVREKSALRDLINAATHIVAQGYESTEEVDTILDQAAQHIFDISQRRVSRGFMPLKDALKDSFEAIEELYARKEHVTGIPTGLKEFDRLTAGLQPSDLIIVAGRPSMGKTSFALTVALHVGIQQKKPVAIFSLEMANAQLVQRMLCSEARVDAYKLRTGYLAESDWPRLTIAAGKLAEASIFIDDTPSISALELRAKARRLKSEHNLGLVIVDYLQLMRGRAKIENRQQEIANISSSLKALARELHTPVMALSQLSRAPEQRSDRRPQLADLRESGAIEQDADLVAMLIREEYYNLTPENEGKADLIIAKQRHGPVGSFKLAFIKEYTRFEDLAK